MVFVVNVDVPQLLLIDRVFQNCLYRITRGQHRMVLVVIPVHTVAADQEQIRDRIHIVADDRKLAIGPVIARVGLGDAQDYAIQQIRMSGQAQRFQLANRHQL